MDRPEPIPDDVDRDDFAEFMEGFNSGIRGDGDLSAEETAGAARVRGLEAGREARKRAEEQAVIDFMLAGEALRLSSSRNAGHGRSFVPGQVAGHRTPSSERTSACSDSSGQAGIEDATDTSESGSSGSAAQGLVRRGRSARDAARA